MDEFFSENKIFEIRNVNIVSCFKKYEWKILNGRIKCRLN